MWFTEGGLGDAAPVADTPPTLILQKRLGIHKPGRAPLPFLGTCETAARRPVGPGGTSIAIVFLPWKPEKNERTSLPVSHNCLRGAEGSCLPLRAGWMAGEELAISFAPKGDGAAAAACFLEPRGSTRVEGRRANAPQD